MIRKHLKTIWYKVGLTKQVMMIFLMFAAVFTGSFAARAVYAVKESVRRNTLLFYEPFRTHAKLALGMWLVFPTGDVKESLCAELLLIRKISRSEVRYETSYLSRLQEGWNEERHCLGRADLIECDAEDVQYFAADDTNIYMGRRGVYFGEYENRNLYMEKMDFLTFKEGEDYLDKIVAGNE